MAKCSRDELWEASAKDPSTELKQCTDTHKQSTRNYTCDGCVALTVLLPHGELLKVMGFCGSLWALDLLAVLQRVVEIPVWAMQLLAGDSEADLWPLVEGCRVAQRRAQKLPSTFVIRNILETKPVPFFDSLTWDHTWAASLAKEIVDSKSRHHRFWASVLEKADVNKYMHNIVFGAIILRSDSGSKPLLKTTNIYRVKDIFSGNPAAFNQLAALAAAQNYLHGGSQGWSVSCHPCEHECCHAASLLKSLFDCESPDAELLLKVLPTTLSCEHGSKLTLRDQVRSRIAQVWTDLWLSSEAVECVVCMASTATVIFDACSHLCLCSDCRYTMVQKLYGTLSKKAAKKKALMCPLCRESSTVSSVM